MTSTGIFDCFRPRSLAEAIAVLLENGDHAALLAGGTDLLVRLKRAQRSVDVVVDLNGMEELRRIEATPQGVEVGALVTPAMIATHPLFQSSGFNALTKAAAAVGALQVRNMATVGGALCNGLRCQYRDQSSFWRSSHGYCLREGGDLCHATGLSSQCVATQSCDLPPAFLALNAHVRIIGPDGMRNTPLADLYTDDATHPLALERAEILSDVILPWPTPATQSDYRKLRLRQAIDRPLLGIATQIGLSEELIINGINIAVCGVGPAIRLVPTLESFIGAQLDAPLSQAIGRVVSRWISPSPVFREVDMTWRKAMGHELVVKQLYSMEKAARSGGVPWSKRRSSHKTDPWEHA